LHFESQEVVFFLLLFELEKRVCVAETKIKEKPEEDGEKRLKREKGEKRGKETSCWAITRAKGTF